MPDQRLTLKDACARFAVTPRTLRYYEQIELITPERVGRSRIYGPKEVARLKLILQGRRFGFSLEEIRRWLELYKEKGSRVQMENFIELADRRILALEDERDSLSAVIAELRELRKLAQAEL